jgi:hypothetical protein
VARSQRQSLTQARPLLDLVHEAQSRRQAAMAFTWSMSAAPALHLSPGS